MRSLSMFIPVALAALLACSEVPEAELGAMELGLTTQANGATYRLAEARFTLDGPSRREFAANGDDELTLDLPSGAYRLTLLEGYQLMRIDGPPTLTPAKLISQNPAPVLITTGQTARVTMRFELADGSNVITGEGKLAVGIAIGASDAGARDGCTSGLRINEFDYEQASSDEQEFIEIVNGGSCTASLAEVSLELVNGNDGRAYGHYALAEAAETLAPGERLVVGDAAVVAALASGVKHMPLNASGLQNGPDGIRLVDGERAIDAVSYEGVVPMLDGSATIADDGPLALARCPDSFDTNDGAVDFRLMAASPGAANACAAESAHP